MQNGLQSGCRPEVFKQERARTPACRQESGFYYLSAPSFSDNRIIREKSRRNLVIILALGILIGIVPEFGAANDIAYLQPDFKLQLSSSGTGEEHGGIGGGEAVDGTIMPGPASREALVAVIERIVTCHEAFDCYVHNAAAVTSTSICT